MLEISLEIGPRWSPQVLICWQRRESSKEQIEATNGHRRHRWARRSRSRPVKAEAVTGEQIEATSSRSSLDQG